ncbi:MAG TPA: hypothetical protein VMV08_08080 [Gaiellaceae bacterium]|nr:hypothetical protein [Gaiellaceae bacterium]
MGSSDGATKNSATWTKINAASTGEQAAGKRAESDVSGVARKR